MYYVLFCFDSFVCEQYAVPLPLFSLWPFGKVGLNAYYSDILEYIYPLKREISCLTFIEHNQCKCILMYSGLMAKITGLK